MFFTQNRNPTSHSLCVKRKPHLLQNQTLLIVTYMFIHSNKIFVNVVRENITISDIKAVSSHSTYCTLYTFTLTCYSQMKKLNLTIVMSFSFCWRKKKITLTNIQRTWSTLRVALQKVSLLNSWYRTKNKQLIVQFNLNSQYYHD